MARIKEVLELVRRRLAPLKDARSGVAKKPAPRDPPRSRQDNGRTKITRAVFPEKK
jgi:hypothetical protein